MFSHEKLEVYKVSVQFIAEVLPGVSTALLEGQLWSARPSLMSFPYGG
jgi:hypothetical protein